MKKNVRILHVVIALDAGGMENGVINVARRLDPEEFEIHVCGLERTGALRERFPRPERVVSLAKPPGIAPRTALHLAGLFRRIQPDIVHTHNLGPLIYGAAARRLTRQPPRLIHGEHRQLMPAEQTFSKLQLRRILYRQCQAVHTVSHMLHDQLTGLRMPAGRLHAIPNGVDTDIFAPGDRRAARQALNLPPDSLIIGITGALRTEKNHAGLIAAFNELADEYPAAHLLIVGDGPERENISRLPGVADRIHIVGHQDNLTDYYRAMNIMALPSRAEGLSNAVLEAMACGIPVLTTNVCGNTEMIDNRHNGFILDDNSTSALARELRHCLADPARLEEIGRRARSVILNKFTLDIMAEQYAALYRAALKG